MSRELENIIDSSNVDEQLDGNHGYWRSLKDAASQLGSQDNGKATSEDTNLDRRTFIKLMGASVALASFAGCRRPTEKIVPYVNKPEDIVPGVANQYATTMALGHQAYGLLVKSNEGRPNKIEGNAMHPSSQGGANAMLLAQPLTLFDPDRSQNVLNQGKAKSYAAFVDFWREKFKSLQDQSGAGFYVLSESFHAPTMHRLQQSFKKAFPKAKWLVYDAFSDQNVHEATKIAFGDYLKPLYHFDRAQTIVALDHDFLHSDPNHIANSKAFSQRRRVENKDAKMNRLYVVEPALTTTGSMADHRLPLSSRLIPVFLANLGYELTKLGLILPTEIRNTVRSYRDVDLNNAQQQWLLNAAKDLFEQRGKSAIVVGSRQPKEVQALAFALNRALGNLGKTLTFCTTN